MKNYDAIRFLYPDAKFSIVNDDVSMITWVGEQYPIPTEEELQNAIQTMEAQEAQKLAAQVAAKGSARAKLAALGLTEEEIAALQN